MKGGKYTKSLAKIWVKGIIRIRDIRGNVLRQFFELCTETPCWHEDPHTTFFCTPHDAGVVKDAKF